MSGVQTTTSTSTQAGVSAEQMQQLIATVDKLKAASDSLKSGVSSYTGGVQQIVAQAPTLTSGISTIHSALSAQILPGSQTLAAGTKQLAEQSPALTAGIQQAAAGGTQFKSEALGQIQSGASQLLAGIQSANTGAKALSAGATEADKGMGTLAAGITQVDTGAGSLSDGTATLKAAVPTLVDGVKQLDDGAGALDTGLGTLSNGIKQVDDGAGSLSDGTGTLKAAVPTLVDGVKQLDDGAGSLDDGMGTLSSGIKQVDDGAKQLSSGSGQLYDGASQLKDGTTTLVSGTKQLVSNNDTLLDGVGQLSDGAAQISDGAGKLRDGSEELGDGLDQVYDGSDTLATSLADGAKEVKETKADDNTYDMFSSPVEASETKITTVENNGHAMAPYMMSVGLWVGCIAFSLMYPLTSYKGKLKSGFSWWISKASVLYTIALLQGLVMIALLHVFDGFTPLEVGKTLAFVCVASVTFMSIMYFFTNSLGKVGSFLMLVFMVIQLAGSVGTYPLEVSGDFVKYLHDWVPFTYTVEAFRSTIAGGESIMNAVIYLLIWFVVFNLLTLIVFQIRARRIKSNKETLDHWLEVHGLA